MRSLVARASLLAFSACNATYSNPPPAERFYFPTGVAHVDVAGSENGALFVAGSNSDGRFTTGLFSAVNLDGVALPAFGAAFDGTPVAVPNLGTVATAEISSYAGELGVLDRGEGKLRFFIPSRSEGMHFQAVDAVVGGDVVALSCFPAAPADAPSDCATNAPSLSPAAYEKTAEGVPRASRPYGVSVRVRACSTDDDCGAGRTCASSGTCLTSDSEPLADLYVTHIDEVDSPLASLKDPRAYLVHLESDSLTVDTSSFINMGWGGSTSAATGGRWTYVSGRFPTMTTSAYGNLLRLVDRAGTVLTTNLQWTHGVRDSRGVALNSDESRLYLAGRNPDVLLVLRVVSPLSDAPSLAVVRSVDLPVAPQQVTVLSRPGQGDLVAITCSGNASGQLDGTLALYDDDVGDLVAQLGGVGLQPYGLAVDRRGAGARLFLSNFGDGRVAVVDLPDLARPQEARLVAHLGASQLCLTQSSTADCSETP